MILDRFSTLFPVLAFVILASPPAMAATSAPEASSSMIKTSNAWARLQPPSSSTSAAYLEIENLADTADALVGASCACAKSVELHVMTEKNGMMTMRHVERFELAPGAVTKLAPGGAHLMIMGLEAPLSVETAIEIELVFERAGKRVVSVPVKDPR